MSTDRIKGAAKIIEGAVKEAAGKAVGNERLQAEGAVEKAVGETQNAIGKARDTLGDALKKSPFAQPFRRSRLEQDRVKRIPLHPSDAL